MSFASGEECIREFYAHAVRNDFSEELFLSETNRNRYVETAVDGYRDYPLFMQVFDGTYDEKTLARMMAVEFKSRLHTTVGIATGGYESVMLIEPPMTKKPGIFQHVRVADPGDYTLLFKKGMYRQEEFEKFALKKRSPYLDETTWYLFVYATRKEFQGQGYGKKLMKQVLSFADSTGNRVCLETNRAENIAMYEHFGFKNVDSSRYRDSLDHYVLLYS